MIHLLFFALAIVALFVEHDPNVSLGILPLLALGGLAAGGAAAAGAAGGDDEPDLEGTYRPDFATPPPATAADLSNNRNPMAAVLAANALGRYAVDQRGKMPGLLDKSAYAPLTGGYDFRLGANQALAGSRETAGDMNRSRGALDLLQAAAQGRGPSAADIAAQQQMAAGQRAIAAQAASAPYSAAGQRAATYATADLGQRVAGQAALAKARERIAAQQAYAQGSGAQANRQAALETRRGQLGLGYRKTDLAQRQSDRGAAMQGNQDVLNKYKADRGIGAQESAANKQLASNVISGVMQAAGSGAAAAFSDVRAKENIQPAGSDIRQLLSMVKPERYQYRDARHDPDYEEEEGPEMAATPITLPVEGRPERVGVMAQDLERSKLGSQMVGQGPDGMRYVDYSPNKFNPMALAAMADMHRRLQKIEGKG